MEDNSSISFWKVAVGILIAAILIGVIFLIARQGKSVANEKLEGVSGMLSEYQDETYAMYDNMEVTGAEVVNVIETSHSKGDYVCVQVKTKAGTVQSYNYVYTEDATAGGKLGAEAATYGNVASTADNYINPSAIFKGSVKHDKNGVLICVYFEQK